MIKFCGLTNVLQLSNVVLSATWKGYELDALEQKLHLCFRSEGH